MTGHSTTRRRRGAAMIVVMALLAVTFVVSYSVLYTGATVARIASNGDRDIRAQQAAAAGMAAALRAMSVSASWGGVGSTLTGSISATAAYSVTYTTGDASLVSTDPEYYQYPYRVTLLSTGTASDPDNPTLTTTHQIRAVVQLVRQAMSSQPANWSLVGTSTVLQTPGSATVEFPCKLQGTASEPVRLYGDLSIFLDYPNGNSRTTFATDLRQMVNAGQTDYRPFHGGPVSIRSSGQSGDDVSIVSSNLGHTVNLFSGSTVSVVPAPPNTLSYQLYAGGATYSTQLVTTTVSGVTYAPDPLTNPLGIFRRGANITLGNNVSITGTLWSTARITISGTSVNLQSFDLPPLYGESTPRRLPVLHADDVAVSGTANCTINGLVACYDDFQFAKGAAAASLVVTGKVACSDLLIEGRNEWDFSSGFWDIYLMLFNNQKSSGEPYYPNWLSSFISQPLTPRVTIQPYGTTVTYLGQGVATPLYVPASGASGLVWDVIDWEDLD